MFKLMHVFAHSYTSALPGRRRRTSPRGASPGSPSGGHVARPPPPVIIFDEFKLDLLNVTTYPVHTNLSLFTAS